MKIQNEVIAFVGLVFLLLGALFGVQIMGFIFGNLDSSGATTFKDANGAIDNLTGAFINATIFTIPEAAEQGFAGDFAVVFALNGTDDTVIAPGNFSVNASLGTLASTGTLYDTVNLSYTFKFRTEAEVTFSNVGNNSLTSLQTYSAQANTQMNTIGITITLLILIALFAIFWKLFIKGDRGRSNEGFS